MNNNDLKSMQAGYKAITTKQQIIAEHSNLPSKDDVKDTLKHMQPLINRLTHGWAFDQQFVGSELYVRLVDELCQAVESLKVTTNDHDDAMSN